MQILLNQNKNKSLSPLNSNLQIQFEQKFNNINDFDIQETINLYELYREEKDKCTSYRLIVTIEPICTNVLYNPLTILLSDDENKGERIVDDSLSKLSTGGDKYTHALYEPSSYDGYTFFNGVNTFDNYLFRSDLFKKATKLDDYYNGKHVYGMDDINSFPTSITNSLFEKDGWIGFVNPSKIVANYIDGSNNMLPTSTPYLKNKKICDNICLYPTPDLFSFNQKLRQKADFIRLENNWNYTLTYPYKSDNTHFLVENGIPILRVAVNENGEIYDEDNIFNIPVVKITTPYPHNLKYNDKIQIKKDDSIIIESIIRIDEKDNRVFWIRNNNYQIEQFQKSRIRKNINGILSDYYLRIFRKIPNWKFESEEITQDNIEDRLKDNNVEFTNSLYSMAFSNTIYNDSNSQITYLDDINLKYLKDNLGRPLTEIYFTVVKNNKGYDSLMSNGKIQNEFNQNNDVEYSHCFGKVTSGFELTLLKTDDYIVPQTEYDNYSSVYYLHNLDETKLGAKPDITVLPNTFSYPIINLSSRSKNPDDQPGDGTNWNKKLTFDKSPKSIDDLLEFNEININNTEFYGDIVEFNPMNSEEVILLPIQHRFNTYQRESSEEIDRILRFHEINLDDDDVTENFWVNYTPLNNAGYVNEIKESCSDRRGSTPTASNGKNFIYRGEINIGPRPEGYYYQPHHKIKLKDYSSKLQQKSFSQIQILPENGYEEELFDYTDDGINNGMRMIYFLTKTSHKLITDDIVRIEWVNNNTTYDKSFLVKCNSKDYNKFLILYDKELWDALEDADIDVTIRYFDKSIPLYSKHIGGGRYVWKDILSVGDKENMLNTYVDHTFTNGNFYLDKQFKLYLKRQDPFNRQNEYNSGLMWTWWPNDLYGDKLNADEYNISPIDKLC